MVKSVVERKWAQTLFCILAFLCPIPGLILFFSAHAVKSPLAKSLLKWLLIGLAFEAVGALLLLLYMRDHTSTLTVAQYGEALLATLRITLIGTLISYVLGLPIGVILYGTSEPALFPNGIVNSVVGFIVNILRSVPFVILLVMTQPIAKALIGTKIGERAFIFYLVVAATPYIARMVESSLKEVDHGVIEAARSMGTGNFYLITKVLLPEAKPSLLTGAAITLTTILGYTPMTYLVAGGGLGSIAIQYGVYRFTPSAMYISSILLVVLVQVFQELFGYLARKTDKRIRT